MALSIVDYNVLGHLIWEARKALSNPEVPRPQALDILDLARSVKCLSMLCYYIHIYLVTNYNFYTATVQY